MGHGQRPAVGRPGGGQDVLELIDDERCTTELGRFNIEFNLDPMGFSADCLRRLETDLDAMLVKVREAAARLDTRVVQIGILPTLEKRDLTLQAMTPVERYYALNEAMNRLRGESFDLRIKGRDFSEWKRIYIKDPLSKLRSKWESR